MLATYSASECAQYREDLFETLAKQAADAKATKAICQPILRSKQAVYKCTQATML